MTGYGRGEYTTEGKTFIVEIKTVNHKHNDVYVKIPKILNKLESKIVEYIKQYIFRGKIDVYITYKSSGVDDKDLVLDEQLAEEYVNVLNKLKQKFDINESIELSLIAKFPDVIRVENVESDEDKLWNILSEALTQAVSQVVEMREKEGEALKNDVEKRLCKAEELLKNLEAKSSNVVEEYKNKLESRIKELMDESCVDDQRIATEVAIFADKSNITEEITRLHSHISQMFNTLDNFDIIGKKLNFILQEMLREANTINSKSSDITIINNIIEIKNEIEEIREQVQNIE